MAMGVFVLVVGGLISYAGLHQSATLPADTGSFEGATTTGTTAADLQTITRLLTRLDAVRWPLSVAPTAATQTMPAQLRRLRAPIARWYENHDLTPHQGRVLLRAIRYANALVAWSRAPDARHVLLARRARRAWRAHDPFLRSS